MSHIIAFAFEFVRERNCSINLRWYIYHYGVENHPDVEEDERNWWEKVTPENYDMIADEARFANCVIESDGSIWSIEQTQQLFSDKVCPCMVPVSCAPCPAPRVLRPVSMHHVYEQPHILATIAIVDAMTAKPPLPEFAEEPQDPGAKCWYINIMTDDTRVRYVRAGFRGTRR